MAKVVCKNCGHKNPMSASVCTNCGNFLFEEPVSSPTVSAPPQVTAPSGYEEQQDQSGQEEPVQETSSYTGPSESITVKTGSGSQALSTMGGFGVLAVILGLEYTNIIVLPSYAFWGFLLLIFVLPSVTRRYGSGVRFTTYGFSFPKAENKETFAYDNIETVVLDRYTRNDQAITLKFKQDHNPVQVDFNSIMTFNTLIRTFNRRRIPIDYKRAQEQSSQGAY